jgi:DNA-binding transcriptional ArsR family regulator
MTVPKNMDGLKFACECVSARHSGYSDPWAAIARNKLLPDGTKELILNLVAHEPKTISQLAAELSLAPPSVHTHVNDMVGSELLREAEEWEKRFPTERYYEPNFPVVKADERAAFDELCRELAARLSDMFAKKLPQLERVFNQSGLSARGWTFADVTQYLFACVQRGARERLEQSGSLTSRQKHKNGAEWIFWAEESNADADKNQRRRKGRRS